MSQVGGNLPYLLFISTAHDHVRLLFNTHRDALRNGKLDGVRISQAEDQFVAFNFSAISDAHNIEMFLKPLGDAVNGIGHETADQPVQRRVCVSVPLRQKMPILSHHSYSGRESHL